MTGLCRAADAMLDAYLFGQAVAEGNKVNWDAMLRERDDIVPLFVGMAGLVAHLRGELARETGEPLEVLDERLIASLLVEGALS